ncbi:MAG TPA: L,D-transpeptidase family protein [Devosiaceae bacterium]|nr:L,D-transpeptidase family protein [Devosiaceae bacterium]
MQLSRRNLLRSAAIAGAAAAFPSLARADSILDMFTRNQVLKDTDREGNTNAALELLQTTEPILSVDTANNLQAAIAQYQPFVAAGGWQQVPQQVFGLVLGNSRSAVVDLKRRLISSGDMAPVQQVDDMFDGDLDKGVRNFQARHGLAVTGKVDEPTYYAMQIPADVRLSQLQLNLTRVQNLAPTLTDSYVVVNIPAASLEAVEGGQVVQRHTAVVGRIDRPTPILSSKITNIVFNPYWHVPQSIIKKDLIPLMQQDPTYLANYHIRTYNNKGVEVDPATINWQSDDALHYAFTQDPGSFNAEGHVKINFPSAEDVYLHDTSEKALFAEDVRFDSSGCMRIKDVNQLVAWLLQGNDGWDQDRVDQAMTGNVSQNVVVKNRQPVHSTYISAWANRLGTVSFRDDVYQYDAQGLTKFETVNG